jgi:aryl-alcohol dehydrogenase-like predicted oxidoreductase
MPATPLHTESGDPLSRITLGCATFGSFSNAMSRAEYGRLVDAALAIGVNAFDTADIYGQGDSERIVGRSLASRRARSFLITKVGKAFSARMRLLRPFKPLLRQVLGHAGRGSLVTGNREANLREDFSIAHIRRALARSATRLGGCPDLLLLHSPPACVAADDEVAAAMAALKARGHCRYIGVSCDDISALEAALRWAEIDALQLPLALRHRLAGTPLLSVIRDRRITVFVREVIRQSPERDAVIAVARALALPGVDSTVIGTLNPAHVKQFEQLVPHQ